MQDIPDLPLLLFMSPSYSGKNNYHSKYNLNFLSKDLLNPQLQAENKRIQLCNIFKNPELIIFHHLTLY